MTLGPRIGKYSPDGRVNAIPGHHILMGALGVLFLWFGWFGFNPGSTLSVTPSIGYIAVTTKGYTYALQDLPAWLTASYGSRADVMAPLSAYAQDASLTVMDVMRIFVRMPVMIYINLFEDPVTMGGLIDRTAPLFLLTYPISYLAGYMTAPYANRKREKMNRRAKKVAVRRTQKSTLAQTLVGDQHGVHYGHRKEEDKHKKKELV